MYKYNGFFYETKCESCEQDYFAKTIREMKTFDEFHKCSDVVVNDKLMTVQVEQQMFFVDDYIIPIEEMSVLRPLDRV
jgi:hypothetical protein